MPEGADPALVVACGLVDVAGWLPLAWRAPDRGGETVLGSAPRAPSGCVAVQAARVLGAGRVVAAGRSEAGLERAREHGATRSCGSTAATPRRHGCREACGGDGPALVVDALGGEPLAAALEACAYGARIVHLGQSAGTAATLASNHVRGKNLDLLGFTVYGVPRPVLAREYARLVTARRGG